MAEGFSRVWTDMEPWLLPVADGGEGTMETLVLATNGRFFAETVRHPSGEGTISARWGMLGDGKTAVVELAQAAGLTLIPPFERDILNAHTFGVGELILAALTHLDTKQLIVCLGGSATNDGGSGLLQALGVEMRDGAGNSLPLGGASLAALETLDCMEDVRRRLPNVELLIACDVDNPLCGARGASAVFAPQKGATSDDVLVLEAALSHYADVLSQQGDDVADIPGSGAAGGTAAALLWFFGERATLRPGIEIVLDAVGFDDALRGADLVVTGEGRLDTQTFGGKTAAGVAARAARAGVPTVAIVGGLDEGVSSDALRNIGISAVISVVPAPCHLEEAIAKAHPWLADAAERAAGWLKLGMALRHEAL